MKFKEFQARIMKIIKKIIIPRQKNENQKKNIEFQFRIMKIINLIIPRPNHENHENLIIPLQNHENH